MLKVLAHKILIDGVIYPMSTITIDDDRHIVVVEPFDKETPQTRFHSGSLIVTTDGNGVIVSIIYD